MRLQGFISVARILLKTLLYHSEPEQRSNVAPRLTTLLLHTHIRIRHGSDNFQDASIARGVS